MRRLRVSVAWNRGLARPVSAGANVRLVGYAAWLHVSATLPFSFPLGRMCRLNLAGTKFRLLSLEHIGKWTCTFQAFRMTLFRSNVLFHIFGVGHFYETQEVVA